MPQIKEYTQQVGAGNEFNTFQANSEAVNITGRQQMQAGDNLAQAGNSIANAIDRAERSKELTGAHVELSALQAEQTNLLKSQSELGTFDMENFQNSYDEKVQAITDKYNMRETHEFIQTTASNAKSHFTTEGFAIAQELSAVKFQADTKTSKANYSMMVNTNPDSLNTAIEGYSGFLDRYMSEHLGSVNSKQIEKAVIKEKQNFKASLALDAIKGVADIDPQKAQKLLEANFLAHYGGDTDLKDKATSYVHEQIRAKEVDETRAQRLVEKAKKAKEEETYNQVISAIMVDDPNINAQSIAKSNMSGELKKSAYNFMAVDNKKEATSAANERFADFADRARLPDGDPNKIYGISDLGKLSEKEFPLKLRLQLTKIIQQADSPEGRVLKSAEDKFIQFAKDRIMGKDELGKMKDPYGAAKYAEFYPEYIRQRDEMRKSGIPISELFKDPKESKSSMYNLVDHYTSSFQEKINSNINILNKTSAPPRPVGPDGKTPLNASEILKNAAKKKGT